GLSSSLRSVTLSREKRASRTESLAVYSCNWRVRLTVILQQTNPDESLKYRSNLKSAADFGALSNLQGTQPSVPRSLTTVKYLNDKNTLGQKPLLDSSILDQSPSCGHFREDDNNCHLHEA
ncbi:hypothetical protein NQZ68_030600, partial [Dissostichus eleginoides]